MTLSPLAGIVLLLVLVFSGRGFRLAWKTQGPGWKPRAWIYGLAAALSFLALAFIPLQI